MDGASAGEIREVGSIQITGGGGRHAVIHPDLPVIDNTVYLLGTKERPAQLMHPGDSLCVPECRWRCWRFRRSRRG